MSQSFRYRRGALGWLVAGVLAASCSNDTDAAGGLMLAVSRDGPLPIDRLELRVESKGSVLHRATYSVPSEAQLPTTLAIASNGDPTASVQITVVGWNDDVPLDRRDAIVTQIPTDRLALLPVVLSARCSERVELVDDEAVSTCGEGDTCDPASGDCRSASIDAETLPSYRRGDEDQLGVGGVGEPPLGMGGDGGAPSLPTDGGAGGAPAIDAAGAAGAAGVAGQGGEPPDAGGAGGGGGMPNAAGAAGDATAGMSGAGGSAEPPLEKFSFFVTSLEGMQQLSGNQDGFGGDLRFGKPTGLEGADVICTQLAEMSMPGASAKSWHAFLSTSTVNARDRVGNGPWYDRLGRIVAANRADLLAQRPIGADATIINDLPNEFGVPNHLHPAGCTVGTTCVTNPDVLTGSKSDGTFYGTLAATCNDWTTKTGGSPRIGHSWAGQSVNWIAAHAVESCVEGVQLVSQNSPGNGVASGGGYGAIYCFALQP